MKYLAVAIPDEQYNRFMAVLFMTFPEGQAKEVVIDDIDEDTFETVQVLT